MNFDFYLNFDLLEELGNFLNKFLNYSNKGSEDEDLNFTFFQKKIQKVYTIMYYSVVF